MTLHLYLCLNNYLLKDTDSQLVVPKSCLPARTCIEDLSSPPANLGYGRQSEKIKKIGIASVTLLNMSSSAINCLFKCKEDPRSY